VSKERDWRGKTLLHKAVAAKKLDAIDLLIARGADPHAVDDDGNTLLHEAFGAMHTTNADVVRKLLALGVSINARNKKGETALLLSCFYARAPLVQALIDAGADSTLRSANTSVVHAAARTDNVEVLELLLANGADGALSLDGVTPLDEAVIGDHYRSISALKRHLDLGASWAEAGTPIREQLEAVARKQGERAARAAIDSGDYARIVEEKLDVSELTDNAWESAGRGNILRAIESLPEDERSTLGAAHALADSLRDAFADSFERRLRL